MASQQTEASTVSVSRRRWPLFSLGVLLFVLGPALYYIQFRLEYLDTPWYVPILATAGVVLMVVSVWQRRGVVRIIGLALFLLVAGFEWHALLIGFRTPQYNGPAQPGQKIPAFATTLADGKAFTDRDLDKGIPTVLVFFRGHW
jgi:hypothetical protein